MRNKLALSIPVLALIFIMMLCGNSCKKQQQCTIHCSTAITRILCMNYTLADIDTVIVTEYSTNDSVKKLSRVYYNSSWNGPDSSIYITSLEAGNNYTISIPATKQEFHVTDMKTIGNYYTIIDCGQLRPVNTVSCADQIDNFKLDGKTTKGYVKLYK